MKVNGMCKRSTLSFGEKRFSPSPDERKLKNGANDVLEILCYIKITKR